MVGMGTVVNVAAIMIGSMFGMIFGSKVPENFQDSLVKGSGVLVMFLGIGGTLSKMIVIENGHLETTGTMMMIASICIGIVLGELLQIEKHLEDFGEWLKVKTGNSGDADFINGFMTASLTLCIGAMAIVGAIQDGIYADHSILFTKAILDFIIVMMMAASLGKGCFFSAIPVGILQGGVTILAHILEPFMTDAAMANLSFVGNIMIFCVGLNLTFGKTIRVGNMLPGLIIAVAWSFIG